MIIFILLLIILFLLFKNHFNLNLLGEFNKIIKSGVLSYTDENNKEFYNPSVNNNIDANEHSHSWKILNSPITQNHNAKNTPFNLLNNFYLGAHTCPYCGKNMYKTIFPVGNEYPLYLSIGDFNLKRIFTCQSCLSFFAPLPGKSLDSGTLLTVKYSNPYRYQFMLEDFDHEGSLNGRSDL